MSAYNVPFHWRRYQERYNMLGSVCKTCGRTFFPLKKICSHCRRDGKIVPSPLSGRGQVYSYTVIRVPPEGFEAFTPYVVGIVELVEGPKVISQIVDCDPSEVYIGMHVEACFRKLRVQGKDGIICYGFKFRIQARKDI